MTRPPLTFHRITVAVAHVAAWQGPRSTLMPKIKALLYPQFFQQLTTQHCCIAFKIRAHTLKRISGEIAVCEARHCRGAFYPRLRLRPPGGISASGHFRSLTRPLDVRYSKNVAPKGITRTPEAGRSRDANSLGCLFVVVTLSLLTS